MRGNAGPMPGECGADAGRARDGAGRMRGATIPDRPREPSEIRAPGAEFRAASAAQASRSQVRRGSGSSELYDAKFTPGG
jgi:hypothetical protein